MAPNMLQRLYALTALASTAAAQSGGIQTGLQYGENWAPTIKDSELVSANFPDVNITLRSPAFLNPEKVPARFAEGTEGPTDLNELDEFTVPTIYGGNYQHGSDALLSGGINPNIHPAIREQLLDFFIPAVGEELESHGLRWEPYVTGASNRTEGSRIAFTEAVTEARTGRNAVGLTQTISFLLEMRGIRIANQHFQRRVATALIKIQTILELARDNADKVKSIVENAREDFINSDKDIVITDSYVPENRTFTMIDQRNGSVVQVPIDFKRTTPSVANLTRARPEAYIIPRTWIDVAERLEILGLKVEKLDYEFRQTLETLVIESSVVEPKLYEGTYLNTVTTNTTIREVVLPVGSFYVSTKQQNAALAFIALEPENIDSYVKFNIIPVQAGMEYPIFRIPRK
ncbi:hypothetical protein FGSG_12533 [Fusarium graminearum PH-1]|uniref:hypothetical protein n=1 Tax=Gibberella zeae (strain ATCC MYA-4620 / CBS 123657 / FGSC 9075 / NRRL 31084 / PH-1) TaxID=229533 RepID=UPI00021F1E5C|nr:hypothetical protein FGSG_12533 [Fusarium graminearum PH-1]ESU10277.1 hypothetical protein FGSG_12533 [Fusarium graminearum PH-1]|eukprot:XP_011322776.1 hypothetical protein FGSG_12533 [Fusarium graminearum PH-1]